MGSYPCCSEVLRALCRSLGHSHSQALDEASSTTPVLGPHGIMGIPVASRRCVASSPEFPVEPSSPLHELASHNRLAGDPLVSRLWEMSSPFWTGEP